MSVRLTVHRATQQIGGNCIEIATGESRIILDVGRPLDAPRDAKNLLPASLDTTRGVEGVLISHPHQDHYGLMEELPADWPIYSGEFAAKLMDLTGSIFGSPPQRDHRYWTANEQLQIGAFRVTPLLTDHSAFDAYMLLVEAGEKRILYSGDFRTHGRKGTLVRRLMASPPPDIDVLLMEGTNLGSDKLTESESHLEDQFLDLFKRTQGRVFVCWSAQNIDRTVTLYRACLKAGRTLVVDLYTAEVLELLAQAGRIPRAGWSNLKVVITRNFSRLYKSKGRDDFVSRMAAHGLSADVLSDHAQKWVVMMRPSLIRDFEAKGVTPGPEDAWSYSQWSGYLRQTDGVALKAWFDAAGSRSEHIHTSGHASVADLKAFSSAINPRALVPIHSAAWDTHAEGFENIVRLADGQPLSL